MEKILKISLNSLFIIALLYSNLWAWGLFLALLMPILGMKWRYTYSFILLPIVLALIASITDSNILFIGMLLLIYLFRLVVKDECYNKTFYPIFFALLAIGLSVYAPFLLVYGLVCVSLTLPVFELPIFSSSFGKQVFQYSFISLLIVSSIYILYPLSKTPKRAYLQQGVWANASQEYTLDKLNNATSYSYSEFVKIIQADTLSNLENLKQYNELWIVTPTKPFKSKDLKKLSDWVFRGGKLILVSDHTDLYGHSRCVNQIANRFDAQIHYSGLIGENGHYVRNIYGQDVPIKTSTNMSGYVFPLIATWDWEEEAYYNNANFFGPLEISQDDIFGTKIIWGYRVYGLGEICYFQDSTIFSNFGVYQPKIRELITSISNPSLIGRLYFILPFILIILIALLYLGEGRLIYVVCICSIFTIPIKRYVSLDYGKQPQIWAGDVNFVYEDTCPYGSISTAYSLSPLSNRKPYWISEPDKTLEDVIWVDSIPPINPKWRWIKVQEVHPHPHYVETPFQELYGLLSMPYIRTESSLMVKEIEASALFSNSVMNDWWYASGISKNRFNRIKTWLNWLERNKEACHFSAYNPSLFTKELYTATLSIENKQYHLRLPKPLQDSGEIYLGNGVSAVIVHNGKKKSIFSQHQYSEAWDSPKAWSIDYK